MANYIPVWRSNYFKVKDDDAFKAWLETVPYCDATQEEKGWVLLQDDIGEMGIPAFRYDEETDEDIEFDLLDEIYPHLQEGEICIVQEIGFEKLRYLVGYSIAVNWKGEQVSCGINDIYRLAQEELGGENITEATY